MNDTYTDDRAYDSWHERETVRQRDAISSAVREALTALDNARKALDKLTGEDLYDVEYAEGGQRVHDLRAYLEDARRAASAADALNTVHRSTF